MTTALGHRRTNEGSLTSVCRFHCPFRVAAQFEAAGAVRLAGASIEGQIGTRGAKLTGTAPAGNALVAEAIRVTGEVFLDEGFEAARAVQYDPANHASAHRYKPVQDAHPPVTTTVRGH
jgi:hypothetical protein